MEQRVRDVEVIQNPHVSCCHMRFARANLHVEGTIRRERHDPEQAARIRVYPWVEVVDLCREIGEVILTSVEVQSNEAERTFVDRSIHSDVDATHETHVGIEKQSLGASVGIRCRAGALHVGDPNETVEIPDR